MKEVNWTFVWAQMVSIAYLVWKWLQVIEKIITPAVVEAEKRALDGMITKDDRKAIAMSIIAQAEAENKIKLSFLQRIVVNNIVDWIAGKLPDYEVSKLAKEVKNAA